MTQILIGLFAGLSVVGGIVVLVAGVVGTTEPATPGPVSRWRAAMASSQAEVRRRAQARARAAGAAAVGLAVWIVTGWFVLGLLLLAVAIGLPWLISPAKAANARIEQLDALAEWTRRLSDVLMLGTGLEQAIITSRKTAPAVLSAEVGELSARLLSGWRPEDALRAFANSLGDATADKVAAALILRSADRGPGLAAALTDLADSVRDEVRQRRQIEADRAKPRTTVRWMTFMTLGVVGFGAFSTEYVAPYGTVLGQLVLTLLLLGFGGTLGWMRSLASYRPTPRFLEPDRRSRVPVAKEATG
ncbi:type II secretion system F family protein [Streptomyces sp. WMMC940]|uniref:type II secretion system F family protein n=1 Tax=Streptomyces sp. WMMC940 TaxID=3015153 RepID=UPI0022B6B1FF|nr:type II secretion system F family protein [Streptomyces sp. WMMC940]MCZ7458218.1 type II secretion system F family protein [Streptomyces sp. WMMC940]